MLKCIYIHQCVHINLGIIFMYIQNFIPEIFIHIHTDSHSDCNK